MNPRFGKTLDETLEYLQQGAYEDLASSQEMVEMLQTDLRRALDIIAVLRSVAESK
jgi:hypothetical protein